MILIMGSWLQVGTGHLVAKNISGFVVTEYEPRLLLDVYDDTNYQISVRAITPGGASSFTDPFELTTGHIHDAITGAGFYNRRG